MKPLALAFGYRSDEVRLPKIPPTKESLEVKIIELNDRSTRPAISASLGCHMVGALMPGPDYSDVPTLIAGVQKRFATRTPDPDPVLWGELLQFARDYVPTQFKPLSSNSDDSVETWLSKCPNYSASRKAELLKTFQSIVNRGDRRNRLVKSFCKDERYAEYKHARAINSRHDKFKTMVGPIFRLIEEVFFKHPDFIKKIPVPDRPRRIFEKLNAVGSPVQCMDFKAMESHFTRLTFELEFEFYEFMVQFLPNGKRFMEEVREIAGLNVCQFRRILVKVLASRMSGEMNTSLGNGYVDWILSKFFAFKNGCLDLHRGFFEGDDSIVVSPYVPTVDDYRIVGFNVEMSVETSIATASFCGIVFDEQDLVNVTNPLDEMTSFGWTNRTYVRSKLSKKMALLRAKSMSLAYQYPGCPVLSALARYGLRVTRGYDPRSVRKNMNAWEKSQFDEAFGRFKLRTFLDAKVGMRTRLLVEKRYGLPVEDQFKTERYLDSLGTLRPLECPWLLKCVHRDQIHHWDHYVFEYDSVGDYIFKQRGVK